MVGLCVFFYFSMESSICSVFCFTNKARISRGETYLLREISLHRRILLQKNYIFIVKAPDIIGGFFTLYESMISTVVNSGFLKILQYTFYMLLGAQIFLLNLSPFYFAVGLQWSPRVKNIPIMHHFQKQKYRYHLPLAFEAAHIFLPGLDIV